MQTPLDSDPWTSLEMQLLYEVANYWKTGVRDPGCSGQMIIDWTSVVEDMNDKSRACFISHRDFTIEECCDIYMSNWANPWHTAPGPRSPWSTAEIELLKEGMAAVPGRYAQHPTADPKLVPDFEEMKIFMNTEACRRGIRSRYYTCPALRRACQRLVRRASSIPSEDMSSLVNLPSTSDTGSHTPQIPLGMFNATMASSNSDDADTNENEQVQFPEDSPPGSSQPQRSLSTTSMTVTLRWQ